MNTSLFISNERITAVTAEGSGKRLTLRQYAAAPLPPGSVLGGVIMDDAGVGQALDSLLAQLTDKVKSVRLVLGSTQIFQKRGVVPKQPKKKLMEWVKSEFSDVDTEGNELVYDCMLLGDLGEDKGSSALLCAAREDLLAAYIDLFTGRDLRISCIDTATAALQKLVWFLPTLQEATCVVLSLDGNALEATLFVKGEFRFSNRTRLIGARGTAESTAEVSRMVSSMIQFNQAERSGETISGVYVLGATEAEAPLLQRISAAYDLPAAALSDEDGIIAAPEKDGQAFHLADYAYAVGDAVGA